MTKHEIAMELAKLRLVYGNNLIPAIDTKMTIAEREMVNILSKMGYLIYSYEAIEDDEGITHGYARGFEFTEQANKLLQEKAK